MTKKTAVTSGVIIILAVWLTILSFQLRRLDDLYDKKMGFPLRYARDYVDAIMVRQDQRIANIASATHYSLFSWRRAVDEGQCDWLSIKRLDMLNDTLSGFISDPYMMQSDSAEEQCVEEWHED